MAHNAVETALMHRDVDAWLTPCRSPFTCCMLPVAKKRKATSTWLETDRALDLPVGLLSSSLSSSHKSTMHFLGSRYLAISSSSSRQSSGCVLSRNTRASRRLCCARYSRCAIVCNTYKRRLYRNFHPLISLHEIWSIGSQENH